MHQYPRAANSQRPHTIIERAGFVDRGDYGYVDGNGWSEFGIMREIAEALKATGQLPEQEESEGDEYVDRLNPLSFFAFRELPPFTSNLGIVALLGEDRGHEEAEN